MQGVLVMGDTSGKGAKVGLLEPIAGWAANADVADAATIPRTRRQPRLLRNSRGVSTGGRAPLSCVRCPSPDTMHSASTARASATR